MNHISIRVKITNALSSVRQLDYYDSQIALDIINLFQYALAALLDFFLDTIKF